MIRVNSLASFIFFFVTGVTCSSDEVFALLEFKHAIGDDPNGSMNNWNASALNPCLWNGISCQEERVVSVSIPRKNLAGMISPAIGSLLHLRHLNLRNNKFYGSLPRELFRLLGLQSLVVNGNLLAGSIPQEIGNLSYLQTLDFSQNYLEGQVPSSVTRCRRLRILNLSKNNLSGSLPESFGSDLSSLSKLNLSFNMLDGPLPMDIGNLSNLEGTVDLSHNAFRGLVPSSLGELPEKVYIDLTYNNLSGPIPQNGGLINRGPTAFLGNPYLCGPPLKNPCVTSSVTGSDSPTSFPFVTAEDQRGRRLNRNVLIAVVVGDVVGICLLGVLFSCCYSKLCRSELDSARKKKKKGTKDCLLCLCRRRDDTDSHSDDGEQQYDLIALDSKVKFNLDELLRASAFVLGKSGVGIVYRVVLEDGTTLAVRRLGEGGSQRFKEFRNEVEAIGKLKHPNVVALKAYYWSIDEKLLIYDYVPRGNLSIAIHAAAPAAAIPWSVRTRIMRGIARGLACLHEISPRKYVHGDLNPNNVLLDDRMEARISDFGLGRLATIAGGWSDTAAQSIRGTPQRGVVDLASCYQAPEAAEAAVKPSQKWDVYSYGVVLLEMVTGRWPVLQVGDVSIGIVRWIQLCIDEKQKLEDVLDPNLVEDSDKEEEMVAVLKIALSCADGSPDRRPAMRDVSEAMDRLFS